MSSGSHWVFHIIYTIALGPDGGNMLAKDAWKIV